MTPPTPFLRSVEVTELRDDDRPFMFDTWARSFRVAPACKPMPDTGFHAWHRPRMERIVRRPGTLVLVARDIERPLFIYGYGVFERLELGGDVLFIAHWVYTKGPFKKRGVASVILRHALEQIGRGALRLAYTHRTYFAEKAEMLGFEFARLRDLYGFEPRARKGAKQRQEEGHR